ncbi:beta-ketoacyl synthase N-terminal-like domain-containing protein [Legionella sp. PATHC035]|uniref:beta-ketoacyl synthase N-terminal-like domain-containing protein n=1 Tax=Legionella sp. PATHC035 TaxID=2992040 RepID=UPI0022441D3D|nr:beta-ketoacyl synthase N-terminal-like domain-containing protein [Legionella sp. PATHC035]MCW8410149.1 beta-ketoacyl synthase N-terminal-like domain-containing protein [Legionella sp. PATHC035]
MSNVFKIKLTADNYLVADHRIDGIRVLPGIAYLDIIARCFESEYFELTQVTYPHAAKVLAGETIILSVVYDSQSQIVEIYHQENDKKIIHFKAAIAFKRPNLPESIALQTAETPTHSMSTLYRLARASLIEHGEFMQVSGTTQINASTIAMKLTLSAKAHPYLSRFYLHPALLDGATFAIAALHFDEVSHAGPDVSYLPLGIDRVHVFARVITPTLVVKAEVIPTHHESLIKCRIHLLTPDGDLVVALEGLTNKRFQRKQFAQQVIQNPLDSQQIVSGDTQEKIKALIKNNLQDAPAVLPPHVSFFDLGFDSSSLIALVDVLEKQFNLELYPTLLFEQNTLEKLTAYIDSHGASAAFSNRETSLKNADYALYVPTRTHINRSSNHKQVLVIHDRFNYDQALEFLQDKAKAAWIIYDTRYHQTELDLQTILNQLAETFSKFVRGSQDTLPLVVISLSLKRPNLVQSVAAFFSCLVKEYPHLNYSILVSDACVKDPVGYLPNRNECVYLQKDQFYAKSYIKLDSPLIHSCIKQGGSYLIVGGNGGLGRLLTHYLIEQYQAHIDVIGRSEPIVPDARVTYYQLDVSDVEAVNQFFNTHKFHIDGLFYLAGEKHDSLLMNIRPEDIEKTLRSKLEGLRAIHHALQHHSLDFYCIYSSLSADIGNLGQSIYAAANAGLNAYACEQEQARLAGKHHSRFISISWPYWSEGGMEINPRQLQKLKEEYGTLPLETPDAFVLLERALSAHVPHVVIANSSLLAHQIVKSNDYRFNQLPQSEPPTPYGPDIKPNNPLPECTEGSSLNKEMDHRVRHELRLLEYPEVAEQDIAIIGISLQLPDAENLEELWNNLKTAKSSIRKVTRKWHYTPYPWGGYLEDIAGFDPLFFNISPREAELIDPQERLFLANAWHCLEDAGYAHIKEKKIGVVAASMFHLYQNYGVEQGQQDPDIKRPQSLGASIANRVSYTLNLTGPSFSLDSMCSSSLTAIDLACRYLANDEVDAMLVGGVNLCSHPYKLASLVQNKFLSSTGRSAPFQEYADGYVPGEGVVVLLLKKATKALEEGDSIYALIKGLALNHGGQSSGFTVPNAQAQVKVIQHALTNAKIRPDQIDYIEAHGTGTSLGDPIELAALKELFGNRSLENPLYVGSIKSNLGHLESAAGMAGIAKLIVQFQAQALAPSIHALPLNPRLNIDDVPIKICTEFLPQQTLRFAGLSSFGAGGSNAHLILQNFSHNLCVRSKTQYKKQNYWFSHSEKMMPYCFQLDMELCALEPIAKFDEICQLDNGSRPMFFNPVTTGALFNKVAIFDALADKGLDRLIGLLNQCISENPEVQFIFIHQCQSHWMELHAFMMSMPKLLKHYHKNILIPHLTSLSSTEVVNIVSNEAHQFDHRMIQYDKTRSTFALNLIKTNNQSLPLLHGGRVVVLGGLGSIGYQFCQTLIGAGISQFDIIGRSGLDPKRQQMLDSLKGQVHYIQHDFSAPYPAKSSYDVIINCLGIMPGNSANEVAQRKRLHFHLSQFIQYHHPQKLISISSLSALAGFSKQVDYAIYNASLLALNAHCKEHVYVYLPFVVTGSTQSTDELNWLTWSKDNQGLEPLRVDDLNLICRQLLTLPAGEYIPFQGSPKQFHHYLTQECFHVPLQKLQQGLSRNKDHSLHELIESILGISAQHIKSEQTFYQLGFNSLTLTELTEAISKHYDMQINPNQFFEFQTIGKLEDYVTTHSSIKPTLHGLSAESSDEVSTVDLANNPANKLGGQDVDEGRAITKRISASSPLNALEPTLSNVVICGYYCSFAQCPTPEDYWHALLAGKDCTQMPLQTRFDHKKNNSIKMGFINHFADFDFAFFDLNFEQAKYMDPQQRKLLELSWHIFEQAGVSPLSLKGQRIGVFVAIQFDDYARLLDRSQLSSLYQITGCAKTFAANRISQFFDFHGPSETIDTACSSSFSALNRAVQAIKHGECESALVLGVSLLCDVKTLELTAQLNVLSPTNECRPFDAQANGYVKGEGLAGVWLVEEDLAVRQELRIEANIKAIQVNHGGHSQSLTAPNPAAQKQLLSQVYQHGISIDEIDYFEAHATATHLGDPIEFSVLNELFSSRVKPLYIGSVKSNIGHTEPVAGLAGVIKGLLMLKHQMIPPQVNFQEVNPFIRLAESPFHIASQAEPALLSTIAINSFGFGGSNGHCVLARKMPLPQQLPNLSYIPIKLSAKTEAALEKKTEQLLDYLCALNNNISLTQLSFTLNVGRADFACRKFFIVENLDDLIEQLKYGSGSIAPQYSHTLSKETLLEFQQLPNQLKDYLNKLAYAYQGGQLINWQRIYKGINAIPLALPVYPFATHYCWFEEQEKRKSINKDLRSIECYKPIWRKKKVAFLELDNYQYVAVFLTRAQEPSVKKAVQQTGYKGFIYFVFVDDTDSVEQGMHWLKEHPCELIYYFAGMCDEEINPDSLLSSQRYGMAGFLNCIKKLDELAYGEKPLKLYVFSNNAYGLKQSTINPYAASIHGLAQSLKKEYPSWFIECIDLAGNTLIPQAFTVSYQGQAYPLVLADDGVWHRQLKALNLSLSHSTPSHEVIVLIGGDGQVGRYLVPEFIERQPRALFIASRNTLPRTEGILHWRRVDCTVGDEVASFIDEVIQNYGVIDCLYHLGASYAESPITLLSYEDYLMQMGAKVLGTYHLINACRRHEVKHIVMTSSVQVYTQNKNRGAYSATCFYADALINALHSEKIKLVHWGFWQQEDEAANQLMCVSGISPITAEQGAYSLQLARCSDQSNLSFFNVSESVKAMMPICSDALAQETEELLLFNQGLDELEHFCFHLMKHHLLTHGVVWSQNYLGQGVCKDYEKYYFALMNRLKDFEQKHVHENKSQVKSQAELLQDHVQLIKKYPQIKPFVQLLTVCAAQFTEVVTGQKTIHQVLFPFGRDDLVRAIYQKNLLASHYNQAIASIVKELAATRHQRIDVLELGGGTGATTEAVLTQCANQIHYTFSDINPQFVAQAKDNFSEYGGVETCTLDINKPAMSQQFDLIIASNVLHTADDIRQCLMNLIPLLRDEGVLIINEATENSLFLAFTFGLFKQWHSPKDEYRISASALLHAHTWQKLLLEMGFAVDAYAMPKEINQSIFIAKLKTRLSYEEQIQEALIPQKETPLILPKIAGIENELLTLLARHVNCSTANLDLNKSLTDYGFDSLAAIHLAEQIKSELEISISPTVLLEKVSISQLINIIEKKKEAVLC